jgi:uncharacterized SAM-binding protein YcdF (DUF218 family)
MKKLWFTVKGVLLCLSLLMITVTFVPLDEWWTADLSGQWNQAQGDVLIVLGGSGPSDNVIGYSSYLRAQYAVEAYRSHPFRVVLITGGGNQVPVALSMRNFMVSQGIPASVLQVEVRSNNTLENALYCKPLLIGLSGSTMLLTSDYHMYRARRVFARQGIPVVPYPVPDAGKQAARLMGRWSAFLELVNETAKIAYYRLRGWV